MRHLFAPWRHTWVTSPTARGEAGHGTGCLFCRVFDSPAEDAANLVVFRGALGLVLLNRFPYNGGHLLIAPRSHAGTLESLSTEARGELMELAARSMEVLGELYHPDGFNLGINQGRAAGAGIPDHIHLHVVPRWSGDHNFMSAVGDTRVISIDLDRTRAEIAARFPRETTG